MLTIEEKIFGLREAILAYEEEMHKDLKVTDNFAADVTNMYEEIEDLRDFVDHLETFFKGVCDDIS